MTNLDLRLKTLLQTWLLAGMVLTVLGFTGLLTSWASILLLPVVWFSGKFWWQAVGEGRSQAIGLLLILLSHSLQVFVPETGFDAVWYHLPVVDHFVSLQGIRYMPALYQSLNPLWGELYHSLGYMLWQETGVKMVSFLMGLSLLAVVYCLALRWLSLPWSWLAVSSVALFQVVCWQMASGYVDLLKAFWEVSFVWWLVSHQELSLADLGWLGVVLGASLATKLFSLFLLPVWLLIIWWRYARQLNWKGVIAVGMIAVMVALPFYLWSYYWTGDALYSFSVHQAKLAEMSGESQTVQYIQQRLTKLPMLPYALLTARDYLFPLGMVVALLFSGLSLSSIWPPTKTDSWLLLFSFSQMGLWWLVPPTSTRYALAGFVIFWLVLLKILQRIPPRKQMIVGRLLVFAILIQFLPRLLVNYRSFRYLSASQTKQEYLQQFQDGWIDEHLEKWHHIELNR